ncbi:MAG TPA: histidine kinase, partial [Edaphobacter sp.]
MAATSSYEAFLPPTHPGEQPVFIGPPAEPTPVSQLVAALRTISPLDGLTDEEYTWLANHGTEVVGDDGSIVFLEGGPVDKLHFILMGEIHVRRRNTTSTTLWIGRAGQMTGKLPFS